MELRFLCIFVLLALGGICQCNVTVDEWWRNAVIYQIYPRSFKDTDGNGIGDLKGIIEKSEHISNIGAGGIWLSPIYKSPMIDFGYDISDFRQIDPLFGSIEDFKKLLKTLNSQGIRLLMDFVPNHSSDEHEWFKKSIKRIPPYTDYYVWVDPKGWKNETTPNPPSNWVSLFEGSAWEYVPERKQFYLHQFAIQQPDLNYRNAALRKEMMDVLRYWLDLGVNGFRMDAVAHIIEDIQIRDEPIWCDAKDSYGYIAYGCLDHIYTTNLNETYTVMQEFRDVLDEYSYKDRVSRFFVAEVYSSVDVLLKYYGTDEHPAASMPFNFFLFGLSWKSNATDFERQIHDIYDHVPKGKWINWVIGNHDVVRAASRFGTEMIDAMHMVTMLLPGTPFTYNGEEIGMVDTNIRWDETVDVSGLNAGPEHYESVSRDPARTPFQWDSSPNAGFSNTTNYTWLPVNPNFWDLNLENQIGKPHSHYNIYIRLTKLRSNEVLKRGDLKTYVLSDWVFAFTRTLKGLESYIVIINLSSKREEVAVQGKISNIGEKLLIHTSSINSEHNTGDIIDLKYKFSMRPKSSLVLTTKTDEKPTTEATTVTSPKTYITTTPVSPTISSADPLSEISLFVTFVAIIIQVIIL